MALDLIQERIPNLQTKVVPSNADDIVLIYIPPSFKKPHMVVKDRKTEFWKRYETDKRTMTIEEIKNDFILSTVINDAFNPQWKKVSFMASLGIK